MACAIVQSVMQFSGNLFFLILNSYKEWKDQIVGDHEFLLYYVVYSIVFSTTHCQLNTVALVFIYYKEAVPMN